MTNTDKLLLFVFEAGRPDQVEALLEISQTKGRPLAVMVIEVARIIGKSACQMDVPLDSVGLADILCPIPLEYRTFRTGQNTGGLAFPGSL